MQESYAQRYAAAGVDVTAGYEAVERIKRHAESTRIPGALGGLGGFGGMFAPNLKGFAEPVFVSGTDSVGSKLRLAFALDKHDTVGIDCVAMCVNDVLCCGAKPLFFLDYIGIHKNIPERIEALAAGVAEGCRQAGCALIGGETAEIPSLYQKDEYDIVGFCVALADKPKLIDGSRIQPGDVLIGLPSTGVHSNGFALIRQLLGDSPEKLNVMLSPLPHSLGEELLIPTRIYVRPVLALMDAVPVKGLAHITGGGFYEKIPRMLPKGCTARIRKDSFPRPAIFDLLATAGNIPEREMYNTFNMGLGMVAAVAAKDADKALKTLEAAGCPSYKVGEVAKGKDSVELV
jgi:phosphoribosylformylglycinamidine cyclo-ligase